MEADYELSSDSAQSASNSSSVSEWPSLLYVALPTKRPRQYSLTPNGYRSASAFSAFGWAAGR
jgi:hypothetical protein